MADTLESLEIEVKHSASGAASEITKISNAIADMGKALGSVLPDLKSYASLLKEIGKAKPPKSVGQKLQESVEYSDKGVIQNIKSVTSNPLSDDLQAQISGADKLRVIAHKAAEALHRMQEAFAKGDETGAWRAREQQLNAAAQAARIEAQAEKEAAKAASESANSTRETGRAIRGLSEEAKKSKSPLDNLIASFKRIAFYRIIRSIIKAITQALQEGLEKAYLFSAGMTDEGHRFAEALDRMKAASNQMKGQLGAAFIALLAAIEPILITLINLVTKAADAISQLLSAFTGTKYLKANNTAAQFADTMKAGGAAAKEWKNQLLGFDEINRLNEPSNGGGGGGSNPLEGFDMVSTDISEFWLKVAERLKPIIEDIKHIFEGLRDFIVGVFTGDWDLAFEGLGKIVEGFGSLVNHVLNGLVIPMFDGFSAKVIERVDGLLQKIEEITGLDLSKIRYNVAFGLNEIRFLLEGFAIQAGWIVQDLCDAVSAILRGDWDSAWKAAGKMVSDASVDVRTEAKTMASVVAGAMMAGGNASADFAQAFSVNMETARGQMAATGSSSLSVSASENGISFAARIMNFVGKIMRIAFAPTFATGGYPDSGQLFIANENGAGAELVGNIGGRTAVASNSDILNGIREGVYEAVTAANSNGNNDVSVRVYLDSREIKAGQQRLNRAWGVG